MEFSSIGMATAFAAGVISFLSPCVLPLVPGYISYVAGRTISPDGRIILDMRIPVFRICPE